MNPKSVRILATAFACFTVYHLNRRAVALVLTKLRDSGLRQQDAGLIVSAQNLSLALTKLVIGLLIDRLQTRTIFSLGLLISGLTTIGFSLANLSSPTLLAALWFLNGFGQGFAVSCVFKLTKEHSPQERFATFWSIMLCAVNAAGSVGPPIANAIAAGFGWRGWLLTIGILPIVTGVFSYQQFPVDSITTKKRSIKKKTAKQEQKEPETAFEIVKMKLFWIVAVGVFVSFFVRQAVPDWTGLYFSQEIGIEDSSVAVFLAIFEVSGIFGRIFSGITSDLAVKWLNNKKFGLPNARFPVAFVLMIISSGALYSYSTQVTSQSSVGWLALVSMALGSTSYGTIVIFTVIASEIVPPSLSSTGATLSSVVSNIGAIFSGLPLSLIANQWSWSTSFVLLQAMTLATVIFQITAVLWMSKSGTKTQAKKKFE